jgi:hypothetical protein
MKEIKEKVEKLDGLNIDAENEDIDETINQIIRAIDIPYAGWDGEFQYFNDNDESIDETEFCMNGGYVSTTFEKNGLYNINIHVSKNNNNKWYAYAYIEQIEL